MYFSLPGIFNEFCDYLNGKIKWSGKSKTFKTEITSLAFQFFDDKFSPEEDLTKTSPWMLIDAVWRYSKPKYTDEGIQIALEHEISFRKNKKILSEEVQRLIDVKSKIKIGILYPASEVDEKNLKDAIEEKLKNSRTMTIPFFEEYLFIFGKPVRQEGKSIILFKAFKYFYESSEYRNLKTESLPERIIRQKE